MKMKKLYSTIKPYAAMSVLVLGISSLSVNATGHKNEYHNPNMSQEKGEGRDNKQAKMKKRFHRLAKKLDLSQEQRSEIKVLFTSMKEGKQAKKATMSSFKARVQPLLQASKFDENKFADIYADFQPSLQKAAMEKAKMRHNILQILTPEQQQKFLTMRKGKHR
jgi:Spy/CpxP family protein refolding chaperone